MEIRAVALNVKWGFDPERVSRFLEAARRLRPLTVRVSVTTPPREGLRPTLKALEELGVEYAAIGIYEGDDMEELVRTYGVFVAVTRIDRYLEFLRRVDRSGEPHLARNVALLLGGVVYDSPYYPATAVKNEGVALSLLYPDDLSALGDVPAILSSAERLGEEFASSIGERFLGVDGSLSPWGERSVAKAVERSIRREDRRMGDPRGHQGSERGHLVLRRPAGGLQRGHAAAGGGRGAEEARREGGIGPPEAGLVRIYVRRRPRHGPDRGGREGAEEDSAGFGGHS